MKVKITMEAEVSDLPAFDNGGEPVGAGHENVFNLLNWCLVCNSNERIMEQMVKKGETEKTLHQAIMEHLRQDLKLSQRLIESVKIGFEG